MIAMLNGKNYTSVGDYVKDLENEYFEFRDKYYDYKTKYEQVIGLFNLLLSDTKENNKEEK